MAGISSIFDNASALPDLFTYLNLNESENYKKTTYNPTNILLYPNCLPSTDFHILPNIAITENMDHISLERKHHHRKLQNRSTRINALSSQNIAHAIKISITDNFNPARTVFLDRSLYQLLLRFPVDSPPASVALQSSTCLADHKLLVHQPIRVARFETYRPTEVSDTSQCLECLLATHGQLAPTKSIKKQARSTSMFSSFRAAAELMLECAHCRVPIPFADIARHQPLSTITHTLELLSKVLGPQHDAQCSGRSGGELVLEDDTQMSVEAVSELNFFPSQTIDSTSGTPFIIALDMIYKRRIHILPEPAPAY